MAAAAHDRTLAVRWDAQRGATSYRIQWKSASQDWDVNRQVTTDGTSTTITELAGGTGFMVRVAAVNGSGAGV